MRTAMRFLLPALSVCALTAALPAQPSKPATKPTSTPSAPSMADSKWPAQIAGKSLKEWMDKLDDPDPSTRDAAIRVLPSFGPAAEKAIPKLLSKMTGDFDATVRCSAMIAVTANGLDDKAQLPKVIDGVAAVMKTNQASVRIQAAYAASRIGKPARDHLTGSLIDLLHDQQSYEVRRAAAVAIGNVCYDEKDQPDQRALTALLGALDDKALVVRVCIVRSMIQLGPPTTIEGISAMRKSLLSRLPKGGRTEPDPALQLWLQACLIRLDAVTTSIRKEDLGPDAESIIKAAKGRIDKGMALLAEKMSDEKLRITAAECLANLAPGSKSQLPKLLEGLQDDKQENYGYMSSCLFAIARIGPDVRAQAEPVVTKLVNHSNPDVKFHAQYALDRLQGKK